MAKYVLNIQDKILERSQTEAKVAKERIGYLLNHLEGLVEIMFRTLVINLIEVTPNKERHNTVGTIIMKPLLQKRLKEIIMLRFLVKIKHKGKHLTTHHQREKGMLVP
jgi:hypothetical protein